MAIADTTLQQLGGRGRLKAMIGARDFSSRDDGRTLHFKFPACPKANVCKITLNALDTYDVTFIKVGRLSRKTYEVPVQTTGEFSGVYCDQLREVFEGFTGLYLSL